MYMYIRKYVVIESKLEAHRFFPYGSVLTETSRNLVQMADVSSSLVACIQGEKENECCLAVCVSLPRYLCHGAACVLGTYVSFVRVYLHF